MEPPALLQMGLSGRGQYIGVMLSWKPVTAGTQRSSEEPHVDESRQGDNERCLHAYACIGMHKHMQHVIAARDQTSLEPVYHRSPIKPPFECSCNSCTS